MSVPPIILMTTINLDPLLQNKLTTCFITVFSL